MGDLSRYLTFTRERHSHPNPTTFQTTQNNVSHVMHLSLAASLVLILLLNVLNYTSPAISEAQQWTQSCSLLSPGIHRNICTQLLNHTIGPFDDGELTQSYFSGVLVLEPMSSPATITIIFPTQADLHETMSTHSPARTVGHQRVMILAWPQDLKTKASSFEEIKSTMTAIAPSVTILDQFYIVALIAGTEKPVIWEVYSICTKIFVMKLSTKQISLTLTPTSRRHNFNHAVLKVVAQPDEGYKFYTDVPRVDGKIVFAGGAGADILQDLQVLFNFRVEPVEGKGWIKREPNSTRLTGMASQIAQREADLSISASAIHDYRAESLHFLPGILYTRGVAFFRQPSVGLNRSLLFLPFAPSVWTTVAAIWVAISVSVLTASKVLRKMLGRAEVDSAGITIVGLICMQGGQLRDEFHKLPLRLIMKTAVVTSILTYQYYTASFVATVSAPTRRINDVQDLGQNGYGIFINPSFPEVALDFVNSPEDHQRMLARTAKLYRNDTDALLKAASPYHRLAFVMNSDGGLRQELQAVMPTEDLCRISRLATKHAQRIKEAMFVRKGSPLAEPLSYGTNLLVERGLNFRYWKSYRREEYFYCLVPTQACDFVVVNVKHTSMTFGFLAVGAVVSLVALIVEFFAFRKSRTA